MSNAQLTYWQAGLESTRGTAVAATRRLYALAGVPEENAGVEYIKQARQGYDANYGTVQTHKIVESVPFEMPAVSAKTLPFWLALFCEGVTSPTGVGPYTWTYDSAATTDDLKTATLEVADGVGAFQLPGAHGKTLELAGKGGTGPAPITAKLEMMAQQLTPSHTMTAALSELDLAGTYLAFKDTALYIDDSAGAIGSAELAGTLEEFTIKLDNNWQARYQGNSSGVFGNNSRGDRFLEFSAVCLFDAATYSEYSDHFRSGASRFVRLRNSGAGNMQLTVDLHTVLQSFSFPEDGGARRVAFMGRSVYDPTLGYSWQIEVQNDDATL